MQLKYDYRGDPGALEPAAAQLGMTLIGIEVRDVSDLTPAFATIAAKGANAILLSPDPLLTATDDIRPQVIAWATGRRLPVVSPSHRVAPTGGLFP